MTRSLKILHLEDDPVDTELVKTTLDREGIACTIIRVENRHDFIAALEGGGIDLILSDYSLPSFDGFSATQIARSQWPDIPFIIVSGTLGEEQAIDSLKSGATDYVLKTRLARLAPAVHRAMQDVERLMTQRRLEAQFIESQKMEVVGQLASGVAHDFNNILAVIMGYCDVITSELPSNSPLLVYTGQIIDASERAVGLTRQLLVFSRKQPVQLVVLDIHDIAKEMETMLRRLIDANIELTIDPGKSSGRVKADRGYVGQVLMNLVVNARDAMPNGGKLTIATSNVTLDESYAHTHADVIPGEYVMLSVSDTGTGMTDDVRAHVFEAFFTTKPPGKGTGLGLATCQTIVQQSGGHIGIYTELDVGTTFKVYFPRVELPLDLTAGPVHVEPLRNGTETLLVVEDEPSVRHLARDILKARGYEVLTAANGQEALQVVRDHHGSSIRLVITDVIMPRMGGNIMAEWLKATYPDIKILFTSGYTDDAISKHGVLDPGVAFLPKPYTNATLSRKVREMLDG